MKHVYFVHYGFAGGGEGNCVITSTRPVTTIEQINEMATIVSHENTRGTPVVVRNFQLLRTEDD